MVADNIYPFILENLLVLTWSVASSLLGLVVFWFRLTSGKCGSRARLDGKTVIVTGSTAGIGEATAYDIASRGAKVILACRNVKKGNIVKDNIRKKTKNAQIIVKELDVSLLSSVRRFADDIINTEDRLDVLIHNAGIVTTGSPVTEENLNSIWATNYFGPFLLTHLLLDLMKRTGKSRIVVVSSMLHTSGEIKENQEDFFTECKSGRDGLKHHFKTYQNTKLAEIFFTKELARRLSNKNVTVNALHPGVVRTSILNNHEQTYIEAICWKLCALVTCLFTKSAEEGAQTSIYLAVSEEVEGVSGKYFSDCKEKEASFLTEDHYLAKKLWCFSEDIVGISSNSRHNKQLPEPKCVT